MRKLIAAMKASVDAKIEGPEGFADWVEAWTDDYGLTPQIDACLLGARMYPGYEQYWSAMQNEADKPLPMTGKLPTSAELAWARFAAKTPHYVLSSTLTSALWPSTRFLRGVGEVAALKRQSGKDIYLMGGARIAASLIEAGLVDELRLSSIHWSPARAKRCSQRWGAAGGSSCRRSSSAAAGASAWFTASPDGQARGRREHQPLRSMEIAARQRLGIQERRHEQGIHRRMRLRRGPFCD